jgi:hypothetical protein
MRVFEEKHITPAGKLLPFTAFKPFDGFVLNGAVGKNESNAY